MRIPREALLLRIFIGESDRSDGRPLYERIVLKAREMHMAGATVLRGPMGFGRSSRLHTAKILRLSEDLPIVVEIVDSEEKIRAFLDALEPIMGSGLVTLEKVQVLRYGGIPGAAAGPARGTAGARRIDPRGPPPGGARPRPSGSAVAGRRPRTPGHRPGGRAPAPARDRPHRERPRPDGGGRIRLVCGLRRGDRRRPSRTRPRDAGLRGLRRPSGLTGTHAGGTGRGRPSSSSATQVKRPSVTLISAPVRPRLTQTSTWRVMEVRPTRTTSA